MDSPSPTKTCLVAAVVSLAAIALFSPRADAASAQDDALPRQDRAALEKTLDQAYRALPHPVSTFHRDVEGDDREITSPVPPHASDDGWLVPAGARATRIYVARGGNGEDYPLEISVYVNQEASLSDPLGSAGGSIRVDKKDGATVVRHSLAGIDESRMRLPASEEERANALTVVRIYVAMPEADHYLADLAQGRRPSESPWQGVNAKRTSEVRTIVVEYHGPAHEVDRLSKATAVAPLRKLLSR